MRERHLGGAARYDSKSIVLHWLTATLVALLWVIAHLIDDFPRGPARIAARSVHVSLGLTLLTVLFVRMVWRMGSGRRLPLANHGWVGYLAKTVHYFLYALLAAVLLLGIANAWARGDSFFGLFTVPKFDPGNDELRETVETLHETLANALLFVAGAHAVAALVHHFVLRDGVLRRMLPGAGPK